MTTLIKKRTLESQETEVVSTKKNKIETKKDPSAIIREILKQEKRKPFSEAFLEFSTTLFGARVLAASYLHWVVGEFGAQVSWNVKTLLDPKYMKLVESADGELRFFFASEGEKHKVDGYCESALPVYWFRKNMTIETRKKEQEDFREKIRSYASLFDDHDAEAVMNDASWEILSEQIYDLFEKRRSGHEQNYVYDLPELLADKTSNEVLYWFHPEENGFFFGGVNKENLKSEPLLKDHSFCFECVKEAPYNNDEANENYLKFSIPEFQKKLKEQKTLEIVRPHFVSLFDVLLKSK